MKKFISEVAVVFDIHVLIELDLDNLLSIDLTLKAFRETKSLNDKDLAYSTATNTRSGVMQINNCNVFQVN